MERTSAGRQRIVTFTWVAAAVVALTVVGASAYLYATTPTGAQRPSIVLSDPEILGMQAKLVVLDATPVYPLGEYTAKLLVDNTTAGDLDPLTDGGSDGLLSFSDADGDGTLSVGDRFTVERGSVGDFVLFVYWRGEQVGLQGWRESVSAALAAESPTPSGYVVDVASASLPRPLAEFGAVLTLDVGTFGRIRTLSDGAREGNLSFMDRDGGGTLTPGDRFVVDLTGPGAYALILTWRTTEVARRTWTQPLPPGAPAITLCCFGGSYLTALGITVESADPMLPLDQYRAVLLQNGTLFRELSPLADGAANHSFRFRDGNSDGNLSAGDRFSFDCAPELPCPGEFPMGYRYEFRIYWGALLAATFSFNH